ADAAGVAEAASSCWPQATRASGSSRDRKAWRKVFMRAVSGVWNCICGEVGAGSRRAFDLDEPFSDLQHLAQAAAQHPVLAVDHQGGRAFGAAAAQEL